MATSQDPSEAEINITEEQTEYFGVPRGTTRVRFLLTPLVVSAQADPETRVMTWGDKDYIVSNIEAIS